MELRQEQILYGVKQGEEDWKEDILSTNPKNFERIKDLAAKDGYGRFRIAIYNGEAPDFGSAINK